MPARSRAVTPAKAAALFECEAGALGHPCACSKAFNLRRPPQQLMLLCFCSSDGRGGQLVSQCQARAVQRSKVECWFTRLLGATHLLAPCQMTARGDRWYMSEAWSSMVQPALAVLLTPACTKCLLRASVIMSGCAALQSQPSLIHLEQDRACQIGPQMRSSL